MLLPPFFHGASPKHSIYFSGCASRAKFWFPEVAAFTLAFPPPLSLPPSTFLILGIASQINALRPILSLRFCFQKKQRQTCIIGFVPLSQIEAGHLPKGLMKLHTCNLVREKTSSLSALFTQKVH